MPLLEVNDLVVDFGRHRRVAVDHVSWSLEAGERLGLIGESGSGKSVTALASWACCLATRTCLARCAGAVRSY